jgi:hypothetical protein
MKILYLSCHSILEYDETKLLTELGHEVFSHGAYVNPQAPQDIKRPPTDAKYNEHMAVLATRFSKDKLSEEMIEWADTIIVQHVPEWIMNNWDQIKHKNVIWRTIGQSTAATEIQLADYRYEGMKIVRYSPKEKNIQMNLGEDATIRFYKDPEEYKDWNGNVERVITLGQAIQKRGAFCNYQAFEAATAPYPRIVFGADNDDLGAMWGGQLSYEDLKRELRDNRVFLYTGTQPASYTLGFIEAMMTGIPIVAVGNDIGNSLFKQEQNTYEIPEIIDSGLSGFVSDSIEVLSDKVGQLLKDEPLRKRISEAGRARAIELFGKETIKKQWETFLNNL